MANIRIYVLAIVLSLCERAFSCGPITHIEISYRALYNYYDKYNGLSYDTIIRQNQDALEAGNAFPDAFYPEICFDAKYHDVAEDTHWTPFINASINYIQKKYPKPWDMETQKLVAFTMGVLSHQVADVSWHSLGIGQGFLEAMAGTNYHGDFSKAHPDGDLGGDVLNLYQLDLQYSDVLGEWYVPVEDVLNIYQEYYGKEEISEEVVVTCTQMLYLQKVAERVAVKEYFTETAKRSPYILDELYTYFLGGIEDMAVWTQRIWKHFTFAMEYGQKRCQMAHSPLFIRCNETSTSLKHRESPGTLRNGFYKKPNFYGSSLADVHVERSGRGVVFRPGKNLKERMNAATKAQEIKDRRQKKLEDIKKMEIKADRPELPEAIFTVKSDYARLGSAYAVADLNGDGNNDVVIGSPGIYSSSQQKSGMVYILFGTDEGLNTTNLDINQAADVKIPGPEDPHSAHSQFGSSLAILDFDKDGNLDIAVGAPSFGSVNLTYTGKVFVYSPVDSRNYKLRGAVTCKDVYCNLGTTLTTGDMNSDLYTDLIIGSPYAPASGEQRGVVGVVHSDKKYAGKDDLTFIFTTKEFAMEGSQNYSWLGKSVTVKKYADREETFMAVGEPIFRKCAKSDCSFDVNDVQAMGQVHLLTFQGNTLKSERKIQGTDEFLMFGSEMAIGRPYDEFTDVVAIAATGRDVMGHVAHISAKFEQAGSVYLYNFTNPIQYPLAVFNGDRKFSRFGAQIEFADLNGDGFDDLIIGAPMRTSDITTQVRVEEGRVFVFMGGKDFPKGDATTNCGILHPVDPCPGEKATRELEFEEKFARFGSKFAVMHFKNKTQLLVTAEHSSAGGRLSGAIALFEF